MTELSSSSFVEEQVTLFTSEAQTQLNEANSFIRGEVNNKLDMIIEGQQFILREMRDIKHNGNGGKKHETKKMD